MPNLPQRKISQDPVFPNLLGGDRFVVLRTPQDEPDITKRNGTTSQETVAAAISKLLPGNIIRVDIPGANQLLTNNAPDPQVQEAAWYTIDGDWNATGNDTRVFVWGLSTEAFSPVGILRDALGAYSFVQVHVPTATTTPFTGGGGGGTIDAYTKSQTDILLSFKLSADKLNQVLTRTDAIAAIAPHNGLTGGASYVVVGTWNGIPNSGVALLAGSTDNFNPVGYITISNNAVPVVADVRAGTYQLLADLVGLDFYEVSLTIRQAVVDGFAAQDAASNTSPFLEEPQPTGSLVSMAFIDPQTRFRYAFEPVAFANGTSNVWTSTKLTR